MPSLKNSLKFSIAILLAAVVFTMHYCNIDPVKGEPEIEFRNMSDTVAYVGMQQCRSCHADIYNSFMETGMGQSFDHATKEKSAADYTHALVYDTINDFYYHPQWRNDSLFFKEFRLSDTGDTLHIREEAIDYVIGSGQHTNSHLINREGYIYQAPITFYTQKGKWDMAPGFEKGYSSRFDRIIEKECMTCHNGLPEMIDESINKYKQVKTGIDCERCHGPGEIHMKEKLAGIIIDTTQQADNSIVNPKRLSKAKQMSICQRCHLQGLAVLQEGKEFDDFLPGMHLHDVFNVYLPKFENADNQFIMASQAERLSQSKCYQLSQMTCITCHNPHKSVKVTPISTFNEKCSNCHGESSKNKDCTLALLKRGENNCSGCHMPKSGSIDIPHVSITDHWIRKNPEAKQKHPQEFDELAAAQKFIGLYCYTDKYPDFYNKAKAQLAFYEKFSEREIFLDSADIFTQQIENPHQKLSLNIHRHYLQKDWNTIADEASIVNWDSIYDKSWTAYRVGEAHLNLQNNEAALQHFEIALEDQSRNLDFMNKRAVALFQLNKFKEAYHAFMEIVGEQETYKEAQSNLGWLYLLSNDAESAEQHLIRAVELDPDYENARMNLAYLYLQKENYKEAKVQLNEVLRINPDNVRVAELLTKLESL